MADGLDQVFDTLVREYAVRDEIVDVDLTAGSAETGDAITAAKQELVAQEVEYANALRGPFRKGLSAAYALEQAGTHELWLNDQVQAENAMADALIRYLVSFGFAKSGSEETARYQYRYSFTVNWDKLREMSEANGIDFDQAMAKAS